MKLLNLFLLLFLCANLQAQKRLTKRQVDSLPHTIPNQFTKIFRKGNSWKEYKMVKKTDFIKFQNSILDSVTILKKDIITKGDIITTQNKNITDLKDTIASLEDKLSTALDKEDNISLLGTQVKKPFYNTILFSIIIGLLLALLFFIYKFKNSISTTKLAEKNLTETEEEFEIYRKKSIEKEQKLRRKLQDEINKQRGV